MKKFSQLIFIAVFLFALAGCNQSGMDLGGGSSSGSSFDPGSGTVSAGSGTQVALVHNPEPTSMLLLGAGLLGLARRFRRK